MYKLLLISDATGQVLHLVLSCCVSVSNECLGGRREVAAMGVGLIRLVDHPSDDEYGMMN